MSVRKYLFWLSDGKIKTYKFLEKEKFEMLRPNGREAYPSMELTEFFAWFFRSAAITDDEMVDFCFLSDQPMEAPVLDYLKSGKSSWDKQEIILFCTQHLGLSNYKIFYSEKDSFMCQNGNIYDENSIRSIYLKCVPEFAVEKQDDVELETKEMSLINRYFRDKLKEARER